MAYYTGRSSLKTINIGTLNVEGNHQCFFFTALMIDGVFGEDSYVNCTTEKRHTIFVLLGFVNFLTFTKCQQAYLI